MAIEGLAHVGIAVNNIDEAIAFFRDKLGAKLDTSRTADGKLNFGLHLSALVSVGSLKLELMQPTRPGMGPVGKFLTERGEGIHHISLKVDNFSESKADFEARGLTVMGELGGVMAFIHPKTLMGILAEFTEIE